MIENASENFDAQAFGLPSHYSAKAQSILRKLILEDWSKSDVKLPTYMKLLARYIQNSGVSEAWLSKLRHQTMASMLAGKSMPRYPFWACLHLYLIKKYGSVELERIKTLADELGESLAKFAVITAPDQLQAQLSNIEHLEISAAEDQPYGYAKIEEKRSAHTDTQTDMNYHVTLTRNWEGIAAEQGRDLVLVLRNAITRELRTRHIALPINAGAER
jgi:hypothetical protein